MAIIYSYPLKNTPVNDDLILISDSADKKKTKQITLGSIKRVTSIIAGSNITISSTGVGGTGDVTINSTGGGGGGGQLPIENQGTQITSAASKINFTGAGVTASNSSNDVTVNIPLGPNSDGNLEVQQVYSNNNTSNVTLDSNSSSTLEFNGNSFLPLTSLTYGSSTAPSSLTLNFVNVNATYPYFIYINNVFTGNTITFQYNGSPDKIFFPGGSGSPLTVPVGSTLIQFNFRKAPSTGSFNVPSGFGTVLASNYSP